MGRLWAAGGNVSVRRWWRRLADWCQWYTDLQADMLFVDHLLVVAVVLLLVFESGTIRMF